MAKYYWGVNRGQTEFSVVVGTSDPSTDFEVSVSTTNVDTDAGAGRLELIQALEMMKNQIMKGNWPPA